MNYFLLIDGQFLLKSNQFRPFPLVFSVRPFLVRTVSAVTPAVASDVAMLAALQSRDPLPRSYVDRILLNTEIPSCSFFAWSSVKDIVVVG